MKKKNGRPKNYLSIEDELQLFGSFVLFKRLRKNARELSERVKVSKEGKMGGTWNTEWVLFPKSLQELLDY